MTITTTPNIEGKTISQYLGIVSGCVIMVFMGGKKMTQKCWQNALDEAITEMKTQAMGLGADAIVGVKAEAYKSGTDYMYITGTAVKF